MRNPMSDVTRILSEIDAGDPRAAEKLLPLVYDELRRMAAAKLAHERPGQTLDATALVHEAYMRLAGPDNQDRWDSRGHFFGAAAEAMRRILINRAREKARLKRGGAWKRLDFDQIEAATNTADDDLILVDEALEQLTQEDPMGAQLVKLRFYAGLSLTEAAKSLRIPLRTAQRHWSYARAWLVEYLSAERST